MSFEKIYGKDLVTIDKNQLKKPISVHGMPGMGMAGKNAVDLFIKVLPNVRKIHEIYSSAFPSHVAILNDGSIRPPKIDIYLAKNPEGNHDFILVTGDFQPSSATGTNVLSSYIVNYLNQLGITQIISLAATPVAAPKEKPKVFMTATSDDLIPPFRELGVKPFIKGVITGMNGTVPAMGKLEHDMDGVILLSETFPQFMEDAKASVSLVRILESYLLLEVNTEELEEKGEKNLKIYEKMMNKKRKQSKRRGRSVGYIS
ncbi:MAG: proteasome assembly chaperone family protein [Candidatus Helarchaeota archaeon]